jgi:sugar/nucleoside kinase (ribokinase family)
MVDVVVRPVEPIAPTSDTASAVRFSRGGAAANVAVALAVAGCDVHYVAAVGSDALGDSVLSELERDHVTPRVIRVEGATGVVVALIAPDGQRSMFTDRGANAQLSASAALELTSGPFDHLHLSGYTLLGADTSEIGRSVIAAAKARGQSVSVDVCSLGPLEQFGPKNFLRAATGATTLFANEEEALSLSGAATCEEALESLAGEFAEVVITRGSLGALGATQSERASVPAVRTEVIDTTGAGDAATGCYLAHRLSGDTLTTSLEAAMVAASGVIGALGSRGQSRL